jgi:hypothetical protein
MLDNGEIEIGSKEYLDDKERRIQNYLKHGKFEINNDLKLNKSTQ